MSEKAVATTSSNEGTVKLISSDKREFLIETKAAQRSSVIKNILEDTTPDGPSDIIEVPVPEVTGEILAKVVEFCTHYKDSPFVPISKPFSPFEPKTLTDICEWDKKFLNVEQEFLFNIIKAANFLDISDLLEVSCKTVAFMIKGKTAEEIRTTFNIQCDFTEEEIAQIKRDNEWVDGLDGTYIF